MVLVGAHEHRWTTRSETERQDKRRTSMNDPAAKVRVLYSVPEAMALLNLSWTQIYELIRTSRLVTVSKAVAGRCRPTRLPTMSIYCSPNPGQQAWRPRQRSPVSTAKRRGNHEDTVPRLRPDVRWQIGLRYLTNGRRQTDHRLWQNSGSGASKGQGPEQAPRARSAGQSHHRYRRHFRP